MGLTIVIRDSTKKGTQKDKLESGEYTKQSAAKAALDKQCKNWKAEQFVIFLHLESKEKGTWYHGEGKLASRVELNSIEDEDDIPEQVKNAARDLEKQSDEYLRILSDWVTNWDWKQLLSEVGGEIVGREDDQPKDSAIDCVKLPIFDQEHQYLITSQVIRALQNKAQLFSLDSSTLVRTRLTHSLEVSEIAKNLIVAGKGFAGKTRSQDAQIMFDRYGFNSDVERDASVVLATAGLLHDVGNPPFGHKGEAAIKEWMGGWCKESDCPVKEEFLQQDLKNYEGNAQALRLLKSTSKMGDLQAINVSHAVVSAMGKYTAPAWLYGEDGVNCEDKIWLHKPGYYWSEREIVKEIGDALGICGDGSIGKEGSDEVQLFARNPLAFLVEAADDIAYTTSDFEDGLIRGIITIDDLDKALKGKEKKREYDPLRSLVKQFISDNSTHQSGLQRAGVHQCVFDLRERMMYGALWVFWYNFEDIRDGKFTQELLTWESSDKRCFVKDLVGDLKGLARNVYKNEGVAASEGKGKSCLTYLLKKYSCFITCNRDSNKYKENLNERLESAKLPRPLKEHVQDVCRSVKSEENVDADSLYAYYEMRAVVDYISLLSDFEAEQEARELAEAEGEESELGLAPE